MGYDMLNEHALKNHGASANLDRRPTDRQSFSRFNTKFNEDRGLAGAFHEAETNKNNDLANGLLGTNDANNIEMYNSRVSPFVAEQQHVTKNIAIPPNQRNEYHGHEMRVVNDKQTGELVTTYSTPGKFTPLSSNNKFSSSSGILK